MQNGYSPMVNNVKTLLKLAKDLPEGDRCVAHLVISNGAKAAVAKGLILKSPMNVVEWLFIENARACQAQEIG